MKTLILFISLLFAFSYYGQITIDENDFYSSGDSVAISTAMDLTIDFAATGANYNWDFSNLTSSSFLYEKAQSMSTAGIIINIQFGPLASSEYQASYFQKFDGLPIDQLISFLPVEISSVNRMVKSESNQLTYPGYSLEAAGQLVGFKSDIIETAYEFPLNFGNQYSSDGYTEIDFAPIYDAAIIMDRHRESEVDGYGQLTTPEGTFEVLRIHHEITEIDSIYFEVGPINQWIPIERTTNEYEWWAKNEKRPILKVETETVLGNEVPTRITYIDNQTAHLKIDKLETKIYPNPTTGILNIQSIKQLKKVSVFSTDGQQVHQQIVNGTNVAINLSHLAPGLYTLQAFSKNTHSFNSIVVQ